MVTLTYRPDVSWSPLHISAYLKRVREWARRRRFELRYVWVLELTRKGVPHYHVLFWLPRGYSMPKADKQGWWPFGWTKSEWARSPIGYLVKYASKGAFWDGVNRLPDGARVWGAGGLTRSQLVIRAWHMAPAWLREFVPREEGVRRSAGWWLNATTGWGYRSPWVVDIANSRLRWVGWSVHDIAVPAMCLGG